MADLTEKRVEGEKAIAEFVGCSVAWLRVEVATYPDPVPVRRFRRRRIWGFRDRLELWRRRHPLDGAPPSGDLVVLVGREDILRVVRLTPRQLRRLLPWSSPLALDPLPVWRGEDGQLRAYRDALHDWLDRQSEHAGAGRAPTRRRWKSKLGSAKRRGGGREPERKAQAA